NLGAARRAKEGDDGLVSRELGEGEDGGGGGRLIVLGDELARTPEHAAGLVHLLDRPLGAFNAVAAGFSDGSSHRKDHGGLDRGGCMGGAEQHEAAPRERAAQSRKCYDRFPPLIPSFGPFAIISHGLSIGESVSGKGECAIGLRFCSQRVTTDRRSSAPG